jgi:hypothetical protein
MRPLILPFFFTAQKGIFNSLQDQIPCSTTSECRWRVAELWGEKNTWLSAGQKTPQHNFYLSVGGVWQNSEERRILDSLRDQIPRNTAFTWVLVACGRTLRREENLTLCGTKNPATQPLPECRWRVAELRGDKNSWLSAGPNTPQYSLYLSVGGVWQNSEERRILYSM